MPDPVLVEAVRTPLGKSGGSLAGVHPADLLGRALSGLVDRAGIDPLEVEQVLGGCVTQAGEQSANVVRTAWLAAGLPQKAAGLSLNCACGSGQQANNLVVSQIAAGAMDVGIGCGVESMSRVPLHSNRTAGTLGHRPPNWSIDMPSQFEAAERIANRRSLTREDLDAFGVRSQAQAQAAWADGRFEREVIPITLEDSDGPSRTIATDEGLRETTVAGLAKLAPILPGGLHTAGTASQLTDGAAALLWASEKRADELGLKPRARVRGQAIIGDDPYYHLDGPIEATRHVLRRAGMTMSDIDLFEVNEAFASIVLSWQQVLHADPERVNVNGGAIALGHPIGATGSRLLTTALHELERRDENVALVTMCVGGAMATATVLERV